MKRILCSVLALLMLVGSLAACAIPGDNTGDTTVADTTAGDAADPSATTVPEETTIPLGLPAELDFNKQTVTILSRDHDWVDDEISVESEQGEPINDAIFKRNVRVEELLNVVIKNDFEKGADNYTISRDRVKMAVESNTAEFDAFVNSTYSTIMYTGLGYYKNLKNCEYLDLEKPWWSQGFNNLASIGKSQFLVSGATNLSLYRLIFVTFFNKDLFNECNVQSLYEIVDNKEWTIDKQMELIPLLYSELDGDGKLSEGDQLGLATNHNMIGVDSYWSAFDMPILKKDDNNYYVYDINVERVSTAVEKLNKLMHETSGTWCYPNTSGDSEQQTIALKFSSGQAGMATLRLIEAESQDMRNMTDKYGVVPMPKFDLEQAEYHSYAHDVITSIGVPTTNSDDDRFNMTCAVLEAMAYYSYDLVIPAYYEQTLKAKFMDDEKSWEMLDLIVNNLVLDGGVFYTKELESIHQKLRTLVGGNLNSTAAIFKALDRVVPAKLKLLMESIQKVEEEQNAG